jgi:2-polyprenyl-3-methyl-5-hydroxy-6-metoxy-1,4-benzoquinol methylase
MAQDTESDTSAELLDRIFDEYSEEIGFESVLIKYKIREVMPFVLGPAALDIGCGVGILCRTLSSTMEYVVGLDGSPAKIARARAFYSAPNVMYICSLFESWSPTQKFNTIVATNVLEHVEDVSVFLGRCQSWLSAAGRLIITVPNALGLHKRVGRSMGLIEDYFALTEADRGKGHLRIYDRQRLEADVTAAGLSIMHSGGILLKPLSHRQMEAWDPRIVDALYEIGKELPDYCSSLMLVATKGSDV